MPEDAKTRRVLILTAIIVLTAGLFVVDWLRLAGLTGRVCYVIPLLIAGSLKRPRLPLWLAGGYTLMIFLGHLGHAPEADASPDLTNRLIGVAFLWVVALIEYQRLRTLAQLEKSESWLHTLFKILPAGISLV